MNEQKPLIPQPNRPQGIPQTPQGNGHPVTPHAHPPQPMRPMTSAPSHPGHTTQPTHPAPMQPARPMIQPAPAGLPKVAAMPMQQTRHDEELDSIGLVDEIATDASGEKKIKAFGVLGVNKAREFKRQPKCTGAGACRVRTFHGKLSDQGMQYIDDAINEWLDAHPDVEVKFVTSSVGQFEGKIREPALVLNLWY